MDPRLGLWLHRLRMTARTRLPGPAVSAIRAVLAATGVQRRYADRVSSELRNYATGYTGLPPIAHYWSNRYLVPMLEPFGFTSSLGMFESYLKQSCVNRSGQTCRFVSIGCGDAESEITLVRALRDSGFSDFEFECVDLNPASLERAASSAAAWNISPQMRFRCADINSWTPGHAFDVILANQFLHHVVELEGLFERIRSILRPDGFFLTDDMIGRNGHMRWPEALQPLQKIWSRLDDRFKRNSGTGEIEREYINWDCSTEGFEGIRAQDVLPLLIRNFHFDFFFAWGNLIDPFIDRTYGPNFDAESAADREFIDELHARDMEGLDSGEFKPTHIIAAMRPGPGPSPRVFRHWTPEFCMRDPRV